MQRIPDRECWTVLTQDIFKIENVGQYSVQRIPKQIMLDSTHTENTDVRECWTVLT